MEKLTHPCRIFTVASILILSLACVQVHAYTMAITWPLNRSVMQRNTSNKANIYFAGQFFNDLTSETDPCPAFSFYYKVERLVLFGLKAVLWHQGEADTQAGTSVANYQSRLQYVINQSRADFGSPNLTWYVARASLTNGTLSPNVIAGQNNLINADPNVHPGPQTDGINVRQDGTHIFQAGLTQHAALWRAAIYATPSTLFPASVTPTANFIMNSPGYPLQTAAGYSEYRWNNSSSPPSTYSTTGDGFCYVKDVSGN